IDDLYFYVKGGRGWPNLNDEISKMPDDDLLTILSRLILKDAVVTGSLSTRWRHLWHNLTRLEFNGTEAINKMGKDETLCGLERGKFINQVNNVIGSHSSSTVKEFLITFDVDGSYSEHIDKWIQFILEKKVEKLKLDFIAKTRDLAKNYNLRLLPSLNAMAVNTMSFKEIFLNGINVDESTLDVLLKNSPHLVKLGVITSHLFTHIRVGGQGINLKYFMLVDCTGFESISLYGFDLVAFIYSGPVDIEFRLTDLPKLRELNMSDVSVGLEYNVFSQLSSCAAYIQILTLDITIEEGLDVNAIIKFPNVRKLTLLMPAKGDDSLLEFTSIARACPRLEIFSISLHWFTPMKKRRKARLVVAPEGHKHLKLLKIIGYYGRVSDLELAVHVIESAAALKEIVIDPYCLAFGKDFPKQDFPKREQAARSAARRQLTPILPPGVNLAIL
ncbi:F-box/FBD/LRR-repeat protein At4g26340-like, partial [Bidens hawaiensis]|uniref:F-box/FBD/LRR-repeat protein At4g26340-like n=1 Tax=Bidens hawaiensis TaxID=980011 RepID=UPI00404AC9C6